MTYTHRTEKHVERRLAPALSAAGIKACTRHFRPTLLQKTCAYTTCAHTFNKLVSNMAHTSAGSFKKTHRSPGQSKLVRCRGQTQNWRRITMLVPTRKYNNVMRREFYERRLPAKTNCDFDLPLPGRTCLPRPECSTARSRTRTRRSGWPPSARRSTPSRTARGRNRTAPAP